LSTQSATSTSSSPARADLDLGVLTAAIPADLVDEVIDEAGCREKRRRRLPARTVVYFVLGMCLFNAADGFCPPGYRAVLKVLTGRWRGVIKGRPVSSSALTQARARLGVKPLQLLFDRVRGPAADTPQPWSHAFGRRVVAWDATTIAVPDTPDNAAAFGYPGISSKRPPKPGHGRGKNNGTNPNVRLMTLIECGTHALIDGVFDGVAKASEIALAPRLIRSLRPGMLLLADRNFPGYELWGQARSSGADLLWRAKSSHRFIPIQYLPDGSYLSLMPSRKERYRLANRRRTGRNDPPREGHPVRVIEFTVTTTTPRGSRTEKYRLVTTLLDPAIAPAVELAALYRQHKSRNDLQQRQTTPDRHRPHPPLPHLPRHPARALRSPHRLPDTHHRARRRRHPGPSRPRPDLVPHHPPRRPCRHHQPHTPQPQPSPTRRHHRDHRRPAWPPPAPHQPPTTRPTLRQIRLQAPRRAPTMPAHHLQNRHPAA
jgi:Insertion element 4 transposase N-terminal/Transposase DDE domain